MANEKSKTSVLRSQLKELNKCRYFYDVSTGRTTFMVQAVRDAEHGDPALVTMFGYADLTAVQIIATREYEGVWDSSWDLVETTPS